MKEVEGEYVGMDVGEAVPLAGTALVETLPSATSSLAHWNAKSAGVGATEVCSGAVVLDGVCGALVSLVFVECWTAGVLGPLSATVVAVGFNSGTGDGATEDAATAGLLGFDDACGACVSFVPLIVTAVNKSMTSGSSLLGAWPSLAILDTAE